MQRTSEVITWLLLSGGFHTTICIYLKHLHMYFTSSFSWVALCSIKTTLNGWNHHSHPLFLLPPLALAYLVVGCHWVLNSCSWLHGLRHCFIHRRGGGKYPVLVRKSLCASRNPSLLGCIHGWLLVIQTSLHSALMLRNALQTCKIQKVTTKISL